MAKRATKASGNCWADLGFKATLWAAADKLRNNMDAAEYKHVVLGLILPKCISDVGLEKQPAFIAQATQGTEPELTGEGARVTGTYHSWRTDSDSIPFRD